jgi:hypothetical protein
LRNLRRFARELGGRFGELDGIDPALTAASIASKMNLASGEAVRPAGNRDGPVVSSSELASEVARWT